MSGGIGKRIDEMYAFVAVHDDQDEGVMGMPTAQGWLPMVGADMARMESLKDLAKVLAQRSGKRIRLLRFSVREELEVFDP